MSIWFIQRRIITTVECSTEIIKNDSGCMAMMQFIKKDVYVLKKLGA